MDVTGLKHILGNYRVPIEEILLSNTNNVWFWGAEGTLISDHKI
jgi:hypothetical protein